MKTSAWFVVVAGVWLGTAARVAAQEPKPNPLDAMLERAKRFTEPGQHHKKLERFLGKWETETRFHVLPGTSTSPEKATAEFSWLIKGRWLKCSWSGPFGGQPAEGFMLIGYDNFRQNYVTTAVTSLDTTMSRAQGDMDASDKSLILYGTIDEYMTGEPDRMVKHVWTFASPDKIVFEVFDMARVENNKVFETTYARVK